MNDMNMRIPLVTLIAALMSAAGCVCQDGIISAQTVTLAVPSGDYTFRTEWETDVLDLVPNAEGHLNFETPRMLWSDNMWVGVVSQATSSDEKLPFLHVASNGVEILSLSPEQIWQLPKDENGASILELK